ncbi:ECF RNA polymerase sigma factor SigW [Aquisphaera giovannonii]|uniref:ECF RNA polymerase sigma factor SigW n=1 Tax=Aquisphaera giovannonii TaxID=406548 RepID=A0A5B9VYG4_9BACT|nr:sigma-70 family RNA polymerase sigma factor [Aquisphaera giovannonii]QEH33348.1 ECF RNA polymerase sigma factor SigW [Aquisphaera giovannonii]
MMETELLRHYVALRDPDAFRALAERHGPMVRSVCRCNLRESHDVDDAVQTTFLIFARQASTIERVEAIGPWLRRVASRVSRRVRVKIEERRIREAARPGVRRDGSMTDPLEPSALATLHEEISSLPDWYRRPLVLCYLEGKTNDEAAKELGCPVGTVKGRLWRARRELRERLIRRGWACTIA